MSKVIKKFEFREKSTNSKYPWSDWFDGRIHGLTPDEDFPGVKTIDHMPPKVKFAARRAYKNVKVQIDRENNMVVLQSTDMTAEEREAEDIKRAEEKANKKAEAESNSTTDEAA